MSFVDKLIDSNEEKLQQFKQEFLDIIQFFVRMFPELKKLSEKLDAREGEYVFKRDQNNYWVVKTMIGNPTRFQKNSPIISHLENFKNQKQKEWEKLVATFQWLMWDNYTYLVLIIVENIFRQSLSGTSLDNAIENEWNLLLEIRKPIVLQAKQVWLQNITLSDDIIQRFSDHIAKIAGENGEETISFKLRLRLIKKEEFQPFCGLFFLQMPRIAACLEILYSVPKQFLYSGPDQMSSEDYINGIKPIEQTRTHLINSALRALRFYSGNQLNVIHFNPKPLNPYINILIPTPVPFPPQPPPFILNFYTDHFSITRDHFEAIKQIQDLMFKFRKSQDIEELYNKIDRLDSIIGVDVFQALAMIWSILEKMLGGKGRLLCYQAAWMAGVTNLTEKRNEYDFWRTINSLRNKYVHGDSLENIFQHLQSYLKNHDIQSVTLVTREKIFRICLFYLLLLQQESLINVNQKTRNKFVENWTTNLCLGKSPIIQFEERFLKWIRWKTATELGRSKKYKASSQLRLIHL